MSRQVVSRARRGLGSARRWASVSMAVRRMDHDPDGQADVEAVHRGLTLPDLSEVRAGACWGVTMVKNEIDIIEETLRHLANQDIDEILVADNGSSDGTLELLHELSHVLPVHVAIDEEVRYFQRQR